MNQPSPPAKIAELIVDAMRDGRKITEIRPEYVPADAAGAYALQRDILRLRDTTVGGWKVGSKSTQGGPINGSLLPEDGLFASGSQVEMIDYPHPILELEIAFRLNREFTPRPEPYSDDEVLSSIGSMGATIEIVSSRFIAWPSIDPLLALGDLLNHGALIVGDFVPYDPEFPFLEPALSFVYAGEDIVPGDGANPAGDPRRLLPWLVNHHTQQGLSVTPEWVITTGSYTGMHPIKAPGLAEGEIRGLPPVSVELI
ncbi:2-keto-4-pentenoate hydratase [Pseudomonas sp. GD03842]|uniref:2-keto-4-pentenoate hydratase n=1 Tax=Pseudomonas sp. GD03842 TaxID=2975385 RepID=UPI002447B82D|nr:2-keto-4-pentenoate hydratase [Pseudomonas sp. GD03842]MDH0744995.1 2-keto-4-pentenoate hydratase [Pseudomonas sp. GD03842]